MMTETTGQSPVKEFTPRQRIFGVVLVGLLAGGMGFMSVQVATLGWHHRHGSLWILVPGFGIAALLMAFPVWVVFEFVGRKLRTGKFFLSRAETLALRAEANNKMGAGKPFGPQAKSWSFLFAILAICCLGATVSIYAGVKTMCDCPGQRGLPYLFFAMAGTCLIAPVWVTVKSILRKRKTGYFLPSQEELAAARLKCATPKPMKTRIIMAVVWTAIAALNIWTSVERIHRDNLNHGHSDTLHWFMLVLWPAIAGVWIWQIFRPRTCALPEAPNTELNAPATQI